MKKIKYVLGILIVLLLCVSGVFLGIYLGNGYSEEEPVATREGLALQYEANVVVDNEETLQAAVNALVEKAAEGHMALEMKPDATSENGIDFVCHIGNPIENNYDMFIVLYDDETQTEIYRSGLIPLGARIEKFSLEKPLAEGTHEVTIVYNQVEEDNMTIHAQVNVGLRCIVK